MKKKIFQKVLAGGMILCVAVAGWCLSPASSRAAENQTVQGGATETKQYASYTFDKTTGCLTFSGKGVIGGEVTAEVKKKYYYDDGWKYQLTGSWRNDINADDVKSIVIKEGVTGIETAGFAFLKHVKEIVVPDSVGSIGDYAFGECDRLKKVIIGDGVVEIGKEAFWRSPVENISLGEKVKTLGDRPFGGYYGTSAGKGGTLKKIQVAKGNPYFKVVSKGLYSKDGKTLYAYPVADSRQVKIAEGTRVIKQLALQGAKMKTVKIPASVQVLEGGAFSDCKSLQKVTFAKKSKLNRTEEYFKSYWSMGGEEYYYTAFGRCPKLKELRFPDSLKKLSAGTVQGCTALKKIYLGKGFAGFGKSRYAGVQLDQSGLKHFESFIVSKKNKKFASEKGVLFSKSKRRLYTYPVKRKDSVYVIPSKVTVIEEEAFSRNCHLKKLVFGKNVKKVKRNAFYDCNKLTVLKMNNKLEEIGEWGFANCRSLKRVSWSKQLKKIGNSAFMDCVHMTSIALYGKDITIENFGFVNCKSVSKIVWPKSLKKLGLSAFKDCEKITSASLAGKDLIISERAFYHCKSLKKVNIQSGVGEIGKNAFAGCIALKSVYIPASVKKIAEAALGYKKEPLASYNGKPYVGEKMTDFTLSGENGTTVQTYAKENGFVFRT